MNGLGMGGDLPQDLFFGLGAHHALAVKSNISATNDFCHFEPPVSVHAAYDSAKVLPEINLGAQGQAPGGLRIALLLYRFLKVCQAFPDDSRLAQ
jgi:hypothetical protein